MKVTLSSEKKKELELMHDSTRDSRVCDRIKAVLLASEGWSNAMISQALRIHETTVARHINDYLQSEKLKPENGGSQSRLSVHADAPPVPSAAPVPGQQSARTRQLRQCRI